MLVAGAASPLARGDTLIWKNTGGTDFNAANSWLNAKVLQPSHSPTFSDTVQFAAPEVSNPQVTSSSATAVAGIEFSSLGSGYTLSSASLGGETLAQLAVGSGGISANNGTGTNTISASLVLNMNQSITQASGGTLNITGPVVLGAADGISLTIGSTGTNGTINFGPSSVQLAGDLTLVTNVNVTLPAVTLLPQPPPAPGSALAGLTKSGSATLTLTGSGNYDGGTTVKAGTLLVTNTSGSATGTGAVVVNSGGTLGGSGYINAESNNVSVSNGGILSPGMGRGSPATLHIQAGALTLSSTSTVQFDLGTGKDLIALSGTTVLNLNGALALNTTSGFSYNQSYTLFSGVTALNGSFGTVTGYDSTMYAPTFTLNGSNYDLSFSSVPEPSTWTAGALALAALIFARRLRILKRRV